MLPVEAGRALFRCRVKGPLTEYLGLSLYHELLCAVCLLQAKGHRGGGGEAVFMERDLGEIDPKVKGACRCPDPKVCLHLYEAIKRRTTSLPAGGNHLANSK